MKNLNYGIIGNCKSAALVSEKGSIDWCCLPAFNSSSVFAVLLDENRGGCFSILAGDNYKISQEYIRNTNILVTKFISGDNAFELVDFMPRYLNEHAHGMNGYTGSHYAPPDLIRYIKHISGKPEFRVKYDPRLEYARYTTRTEVFEDYIKSNTSKGTYDSLYMYTDLDKHKVLQGKNIQIQSDAFFVISYNQKLTRQTVDRAYLKLQRTKVYWLNWSERTKSYDHFDKEIKRSALVLKLLSYDKSGALLAAVTTSLPETIGEVRNWDYRFCWLRDASMVSRVMTDLGHLNMVKRYMNFIIDIIPDKDEKIQIMYGINRDKKLTEKILDHLSGYLNSTPVRIGNDAYKQKQNDIYGILMDVIHQQFEIFITSLENSEALWTITRSVVKTVSRNWRKPDRGIWEIRTDQKHFTFSKVLCWVAIDRAIKIARLIKAKYYVEKWTEICNEIKADVMKKAWNDELNVFTQYYGSSEMDASNLLMESYGFIAAGDPRYINTVLTTGKYLLRNGLMYRYKNKDDFGVPSSSFTICTFWLIDSLYKIGKKKKAVELFRNILKYGNHLGLYSEDIDFKSKRLLGNFPQAYSHLALIETAVIISEGALSKDQETLSAINKSTDRLS